MAALASFLVSGVMLDARESNNIFMHHCAIIITFQYSRMVVMF